MSTLALEDLDEPALQLLGLSRACVRSCCARTVRLPIIETCRREPSRTGPARAG
jgi:hypothetical protein